MEASLNPFLLFWCCCSTIAAADRGGIESLGKGWEYSRLGNETDIATATHFGIVFEGGATDVGAAYRWMCAKSNGGDFLVIRASGTAAYNPYIAGLCPSLNSISTLKIYNRTGAFDPFVSDTIAHAEAIFIAGGNQADYVNYWQGTPVQAAVNARAAAQIPIGGTSAGNAVLAQFAFSALNDTVTSSQALANPYDPLITISYSFLSLAAITANTITDDHFVARDRMGRLVTFFARILNDGSAKQVKGIAVDENAAFLMEADGTGSAVGTGAVYFLKSNGRAKVCKKNTPLTYLNLPVYRIGAAGRFNLNTWTGSGGSAYDISAVGGVLHSTQPGGAIY